MNDTNRVINRLLLAVTGIALLAVAGLAVALIAVPDAGRLWRGIGRSATTAADGVFGVRLWPGTTLSLAALIALAVAALFVILLIVQVVRAGHGATSTVLTLSTPDGSVELDAAVPAALLTEQLKPVPGVAGVAVSAYRVRRTPALKVTVRCRRGASPREVADAVDEAVALLDSALGTTLPVFAQLVGGFRSRLQAATRVDTSTSAARPS
ncbi:MULTISPECIES: hypothetical protein [unclassified Leifsonia]|uniref:hypothetical protein n=1 Tax=unclassified Leifsonia TaxID=2663824 RepID=UPI000372534A|nr:MULTISPECIES: hypothetical protein [unclassified Leifsonia]TDP98579.1 hypothetical protein AXZ95_2478 [Leifsonia sp. 115AMFTsu3.1]